MRDIVVGMSNERLVEVKSGLKEGERVVQNPQPLLTDDSDLKAGPRFAPRTRTNLGDGGEGGKKGKKSSKKSAGAAPGPDADGLAVRQRAAKARSAPAQPTSRCNRPSCSRWKAPRPEGRRDMINSMPDAAMRHQVRHGLAG